MRFAVVLTAYNQGGQSILKEYKNKWNALAITYPNEKEVFSEISKQSSVTNPKNFEKLQTFVKELIVAKGIADPADDYEPYLKLSRESIKDVQV